MSEIRKLSRSIAEAYNPDKIILFGSYATGVPTDSSDIDLLVVMSFKGKSARKACEILARVKTTLPVDILVRSPVQLRRRLAWNDYFFADIMDKGKTLHEAAR
ncbi:MAG: nucleotidyltransferase domain-containing protein [Nitrospinae bacterium]|nr:nucleotidyltransferase domain-containing protein [Nitrospinota bacterium]